MSDNPNIPKPIDTNLGKHGPDRVGKGTTHPADTKAIVPIEITAVQSVQLLYNMMAELKKKVLKPDIDYGVIPGTGTKPTLLLPGMEKIMRALNAIPEYVEREVIRDYNQPLFHYEYECRLVDCETGIAIPGGRGLGLCTSMESSFRWRWVDEHEVSANLDMPELKKRISSIVEFDFAIDKRETTGKWGKPAAYWMRFEDAIKSGKANETTRKTKSGESKAWEISTTLYRIENPDIFDQVNAIMKRAKKRALGDAIKGAAAVSEFFTTDLEDFTPYEITSPDNVVEAEYTEITVSTPPAADQQHLSTPPATPPADPSPANGDKGSDEISPSFIEKLGKAIDFMYDNEFHRDGSIKKLIAEQTITPKDTMRGAQAKVLFHRAFIDHLMDEKMVLEALSASVHNDPVIKSYGKDWIEKLGRTAEQAWVAIQKYSELANEAPATAKGETDVDKVNDVPF